ncbi:MAG: rRNA maturation RNase YbeY [Bacteroides sp.]|nr:rRNA maturation RNase YbeY [Eubacterium sp.]MCM1417923.1 rRNA maturation RNase YbeY [Roseburia sp.]MCM1461914.1 rRNA maturation RNase YbeY [Bacteroides sp.]
MVSIRIYGENHQKKYPITPRMRTIVKKCCLRALFEEGYHDNFEVSVSFVDNAEIRALNAKHRANDRETDVLSFPMLDEGGFPANPDTDCLMLGDIVISLEKAFEQAKEYGHGFERELAFLTVHSMLHLLGYDHLDEEEEKEMLGKQELILNSLGITR